MSDGVFEIGLVDFAGRNGFLGIYPGGQFDPQATCQNLLAHENETSGSGAEVEKLALTAGVYTLVVSGTTPNDLGAYVVSVYGENATFTVPLAEAPTSGVHLTPAYPNPTYSTARVRLTLDRAESVSLTLADALGREVRSLADGPFAAGVTHTLDIPTLGLPSGPYVLRISGDTFAATRRLTVVR